MRFRSTSLPDVCLVEQEPRGDDRGSFSRVFCEREFHEAGLVARFVQANSSGNKARGTLRGLHYQLPPSAEVKLVRCTRGALFDVVVDVRPGSATHGRWFGAELSEHNGTMMYVPRGFAHGYLTLEDDTEAHYLVSDFYAPDLERGLRWNDPLLDIRWPMAPKVLSAKDSAWPDFGADDPRVDS